MESLLRLTPSYGDKKKLVTEDGLIQFRLGLWVDGVELDHLTVNSGGSGRQTQSNLKLYGDAASLPGSFEPIPEGYYGLGSYEFQRANDYGGNWGTGLGPVWFQITPKGSGRRSDFGIHLDSNRSYAPGSAGCVVARNLDDLKTIVEWSKKYNPSKLTVDYGLGSVSKPQTTAKPTPPSPPVSAISVTPFKIYVNDNGFVLDISEDLKAGQYQLFSDIHDWGGKLRRR